jgi:hypothetical protein
MTEQKTESTKKEFPKKKALGCALWLLVIPLIIVACMAPNNNDKDVKEDKPKTEQKADKPVDAPVAKDWKVAIKEIAATSKDADVSNSGRYDDVMKLAKANPIKSQDDLIKYLSDIVGEYEEKKYLATPENHEYMLTNMYKAAAISEIAEEGKPAGDFAFDFLQNVKYVYRGVDAPDSDAIKANEAQMDKALAEIAKAIEN